MSKRLLLLRILFLLSENKKKWKGREDRGLIEERMEEGKYHISRQARTTDDEEAAIK